MTSVKFRFLGAPSVEVDGILTDRFRWSKLPAVFAYLVLNPGEQTRESIADALWPNRPTENGRQNLRQTLLYADQLLGPAADQVLKITRQTVALKKSAVSSDIDAFVRRPSRQFDGEERLRCLHLVESYTGPFLPNMGDEWILNARVQIARTFQEALVFLARDMLADDPLQSLTFAERAIQEDPFDDPGRAAKIEALLALGREAGAKQEFDSYADFLKQELGMQPGRIVSDALHQRGKPLPPQPRLEPVDTKTEAIASAVQLLRDRGLYEEASNLAVALVPTWIEMGTPAYGKKLLLGVLNARKRPVRFFEKLALAKLSQSEGDLVKTRELCEEILRSSPSTDVAAESMLVMAWIELSEVRAPRALAYALNSVRLSRKLGNEELEFKGWNCLAIARFTNGQFSRALNPTRRAEKLSEIFTQSNQRQDIRLLRALALLRLGRHAEAGQIAETVRSEITVLATPYADRIKSTLGRIFEGIRRPEEAKILYAEAAAESRNRQNVFALNVVLTYLGDLELELGNFDESQRIHFEALHSRRKLKQNLGMATNLRGIGRALIQQKRFTEARPHLQESTQRYRDENALSGYASSQLLLAQAEFEAGDPVLARRLALNSMEVLRGMSFSGRITIGPWGERILEEGEDFLRRIDGVRP